MPKFVRLDPDDATFVDVIHTDAKSILMLGKKTKKFKIIFMLRKSKNKDSHLKCITVLTLQLISNESAC
jgi:hypothetical protein